jgi:hypothetical protein
MHPRGYLRIHHRLARRLVLVMTGLALTLGALPALTGALPGMTAVTAQADNFTASLNTLRTGWDSNEANMSPAQAKAFTQRFSVSVTGQVYAQPLVIDSLNTVVVATEDDWVYGLNATTGATIWSTHLGSPFNIAGDSTFSKCTDLVPHIGVTGTPVYDPSTQRLYMFANILASGKPHYYLVEMDATSGGVVQKVSIGGHPSNDSHITFSPTMQMERPGVLLASDGGIWGAFASHCDHKPYSGYVVRVDLSSQTASLWTDESGVTYNRAGIWMGGGGVMQDGQGRIFVTSGNGVSPPKSKTPGGQLAESVIRLAYNGTSISAQDFFSPANAPKLDAADTDFGAGGPVGLPFGTANTARTTYYHSILAAPGKDGRVFLLNRSHLGGREQGPNNTDKVLGVKKTAGGEWGHPAIFANTNPLTPVNVGSARDYLIYVGKDAHMQVFKFGVTSSGKPTLADVANSSLTYGYTSGSPVVTSANTNDPASAVIWEVYTPNTVGKTGAGAQLEAYSLPAASCKSSAPCTLTHLGSWPIGHSAKFCIPATSNGWVYVGTRDDHVLGFSLPATAAPAAGTTANFAQTAVGASSSTSVSITARHAVTVTGVTASTGGSNAPAVTTQFTVGQVSKIAKGSTTPVPVTFPVTLAKGDRLTTRATFAPAAPGGADGALTFTTTSAKFPTVSVPVAGNGTQTGLYPSPSSMTFPLAPDQGVAEVPVGIIKPEEVNVTNFGTTTQTVTSVTPPSAPFSASGLPAVGTKIKPGESFTVQLNFAPTAAGPASGSFTIAGSSGSPATVSLSGVGIAPVSQVIAASQVVNFGKIKVGRKATAYIHVSNDGNTASTVQGTAPMPAPFAAPLKASPGLPFNPESDLSLPVTFTPGKKGTFTAQYKLTWSDVNGIHTLTVTLEGTAV